MGSNPGIDYDQLAQDKTFLGMQPADQIGYLSSQDPAFAKMTPSDQAGYVQHLTGKSVRVSPNVSPSQATNVNSAPAPASPAPKIPNNSLSFSDGFGSLKSKGPTDEQLVSAYDQSHPILGKLARAAFSAGDTAMSIPSALYHAAIDPATAEEKKEFPHQIPGEITMSRLVGANPTADAAVDYIRGRVTPKAALSVLPEAVGSGVGNVAGSAFFPKILEAATSAAVPAASVVKGAAKASGIGLSPIEKLVKAAGPSVRDANFPQALETAAPELARQHAVTPIKTVSDMAEGAHTAADNLWKQQIEPQIARNATEVINERLPESAPEGFPKAEAQGSIGDAIRGGIDPGMARMFPKETAVVQDFAKRLDQPMTLAEANENLRALNAKLKSYYKMTPEGRAAIGVTDGMTSAMEEGAAGLRQKMYDKLDSLGETDPAGLRQQYGALKQVQDVFRRRAIVSGRQAPLNLPQMLSLAGGAGEAAGALLSGHPVAAAAGGAPIAITSLLKFLNSPDSLVGRGVAGLPAAPEEPFTLSPPAGRVPAPLQRILSLSGGENIPGEDLKLTHPGEMPPDVQRPLSFMESPSSNASGPVYPGGKGTAPTPLQQILNAAKPAPQPNLPRSLGAAAAAPTVEEIPQVLREAAGIQGGHAGSKVASVEELERPGTNYVVSPEGRLTYHGKAFAPEEAPKGAAHVTILPDGSLRVNEGVLTPAMKKALQNGVKNLKTISKAEAQRDDNLAA